MLRSLACRALALVLAVVAAGCAEPAATPTTGTCTLEKRAETSLRISRNFMLATVRLDGRAATVVVDTGAETTMLTPPTVARLGLRAGSHASVLRGVAGTVRSANARLHRLAMDDMILSSNLEIGVGELPAFPGVHPPVAGLLGTDVLAHYEVELDVPARRLALYTLHGCADFTPWPRAAAFPLQRTAGGLTFVAAQVEGQRIRAMLDTGARTTLLTRQTAASLGVSAATLDAAESRQGMGIGRDSIVFRQHRFAELGLPGDLARGVDVNVAELDLPGVDMLLGADYLGQRHVWISYATGRLFLR